MDAFKARANVLSASARAHLIGPVADIVISYFWDKRIARLIEKYGLDITFTRANVVQIGISWYRTHVVRYFVSQSDPADRLGIISREVFSFAQILDYIFAESDELAWLMDITGSGIPAMRNSAIRWARLRLEGFSQSHQ